MIRLSEGDAREVAEVLRERLGWAFDDFRLAEVSRVVLERLEGRTLPEYLQALGSGSELRALAARLSVGESYFMRQRDQFRALAEACLPGRLQARSGTRVLRLLSAGCSCGEEVYSLSMVLRDRFPHLAGEGWHLEILGLDLNPEALACARRGRYSEWALRELTEDERRRHFRRDGKAWTLREPLRDGVRFEERNLLHEEWAPESLDAILCRNVLMYLTPEAATSVVGRFARALVPGGALFLGHAENLRGLSLDFHLRHTHDCFYYLRSDGLTEEPAPARTAPEPVGDGSTWIDAIGHAAATISRLAEKRAEPPPRPSPPDLASALESLREERFEEALERLGPGGEGDPDVLLLRASLLTNSGDIAGAEEACRRVLALDELSAGAHYLLALCREQAGDLEAAREEDLLAVHLEPGFAMPHLHLGLLLRRQGSREEARAEFSEALRLLPAQGSARVLLFGGGFGREALIRFCREQLRACGGEP